MISQIDGLPAGALGFECHGRVTAGEYAGMIAPDVEAAFMVNSRLRVLYVFGADFAGFDAGAVWEDVQTGLRHYIGWERVAIVTDQAWLRVAATALGLAVPAEVRVFPMAERAAATAWIAEPSA